MVKAIWNGAVIAESDVTTIVEGNHYFPPADVDDRYLEASERTSHCPWKGDARYYDLVVDGDRNPDAAWFYPDPNPAARAIADRVAFSRSVKVVEG